MEVLAFLALCYHANLATIRLEMEFNPAASINLEVFVRKNECGARNLS